MPEERQTEQPGALVKGTGVSLEKLSSTLARRALQDLCRLTTDPEVARLVRQMVKSTHWQERHDAWQKLHVMGPPFQGWTESLREAISQGDGWARLFAADALSCFQCSPEDAVPVLEAVVRACSEVPGCDRWGSVASEALANYVGLDPPLVERTAPALLTLLEALDNVPTLGLTYDSETRGYSLLALNNWGRLSAQGLAHLLPQLLDRDDPRWQMFCEAARKIDPRAVTPVDALTVVLEYSDAKARCKAVAACYGGTETPALPILLKLVHDDDFTVRKGLALKLRRLPGSREAVEALVALTNDPEDSVKIAAFYSLAMLLIDTDQNVRCLSRLIPYADTEVRTEVAWGLCDLWKFFKTPGALEPIQALTNDPDDLVRLRAYQVLVIKNIDAEHNLRCLLTFVSHPDARAREALAHALWLSSMRPGLALQAKLGLQALTNDPDDLIKILAYGRLVFNEVDAEDNMRCLLGFLSHPDARARQSCASQLSTVAGHDSVLSRLRQALSQLSLGMAEFHNLSAILEATGR